MSTLGNVILVQNVVSRIAHGLMGLDLFTQKKERNDYLRDFLTLKPMELEQAFTPSPGTKLVPNSGRASLEEWAIFIGKIQGAQKVIENIEKADEREIEGVVNDLQDAIRFFYSYTRR